MLQSLKPTVTPTRHSPVIKNGPIPGWKPIPDLHINPKTFEKYKDCFPQTPLYSKSGKSYHPPGSAQWQKVTKKAYEERKMIALINQELSIRAQEAVVLGTTKAHVI